MRQTAAALILCWFSILAHAEAPPAAQPPKSGTTGLAPIHPDASRHVGGTVIVGSVAGWQLSESERIARRTAGPSGSRSVDSVPKAGYSEKIDGLEHPELFLPYELFDFLLYGVSSDASRQAEVRARLTPRIRVFGYDPDQFWMRLDAAARPYALLRERERSRAHHRSTLFTTPSGKTTLVPISKEACAARIDALREATALLGGKDFERFLYVVVAPDSGTSSTGNNPERGEQLRYMAGGCK